MQPGFLGIILLAAAVAAGTLVLFPFLCFVVFG